MTRTGFLLPFDATTLPGRAGEGRSPLRCALVLVLTLAVIVAPSGASETGKSEVDGAAPIRISSVRWSAAGYMLDVRYNVLDVDGAWDAFNRKERPVLGHHESGAVLAVPAPAKVGPLVQTSERPKPDRVYFILFANPGRLVQPGDTVILTVAGREYGPFVVEGGV